MKTALSLLAALIGLAGTAANHNYISPATIAKETSVLGTSHLPASNEPFYCGYAILMRAGTSCATKTCEERESIFVQAAEEFSSSAKVAVDFVELDAEAERDGLLTWVHHDHLSRADISIESLRNFPQVMMVRAAGGVVAQEVEMQQSGRGMQQQQQQQQQQDGPPQTLWSSALPSDLMTANRSTPLVKVSLFQSPEWGSATELVYKVRCVCGDLQGNQVPPGRVYKWVDRLAWKVDDNGGRLVKVKPPKSVDPDAPAMSGLTPLVNAVQKLDVPVTQSLLKSGADPNAPAANFGETPLHTLVGQGDFSHARALGTISAEASMDDSDPVMSAFDILDSLLDAGADPCKANVAKRTPVHSAVSAWMSMPVAPTLARFDKKESAQFEETGLWSPHIQMAHDLVKAGCPADTPDALGFTAVHMAAHHHSLEGVQAFVGDKHGIDAAPDSAAASGDVPLHMPFHMSSFMTAESMSWSKRIATDEESMGASASEDEFDEGEEQPGPALNDFPSRFEGMPLRPKAMWQLQKEYVEQYRKERAADGTHPVNGTHTWQPTYGEIADLYCNEAGPVLPIVQQLLAACKRKDSECGTSALDGQGLTPLAKAAEMNAHTALREMLRFGADPLTRLEGANRTALHVAALRGFPKAIRALLDPLTGAPALAEGQAAPRLAFEPGELLLAQDVLGRTALDYAMALSNDDAIAALRSEAARLGVTLPKAEGRRACTAAADAQGGAQVAVCQRGNSSSMQWSDMPDRSLFAAGGDLDPARILERVAAGRAAWEKFTDEIALEDAADLDKRLSEEYGECAFDVVPASEMTPDRFTHEYVAAGRPVLIKQALNASWPLWDTFLPSGLKRDFGEWVLDLGPISYSQALGWPTARLSLKDYLNHYLPDVTGEGLMEALGKQEDRVYAAVEGRLPEPRKPKRGRKQQHQDMLEGVDAVVDNVLGTQSMTMSEVDHLLGVWNHTVAPMYVSRPGAGDAFYLDLMNEGAMDYLFDRNTFRYSSSHIFFGPPLSGTHMHFHPDAINIMTYGSKRWFVLPPANSIFSHLSANEFHRETAPRLEHRMLQCTQRAGDIAFVPSHWGHNILNLEPTIAAALEFIRIPHQERVFAQQFHSAGDGAMDPAIVKNLREALLGHVDTA